jgi:hypothetical protein
MIGPVFAHASVPSQEEQLRRLRLAEIRDRLECGVYERPEDVKFLLELVDGEEADDNAWILIAGGFLAFFLALVSSPLWFDGFWKSLKELLV